MWSEAAVPRRVLVVAPHPDDEAIGCAGTLLLHARAGDAVHVAIATDGGRSLAVPRRSAMAAIRRREAERAAALLSVHRLSLLGLHEGEWQVNGLAAQLQALLQDFAPDILYAPSRVDFHPEHHKTAHALALALAGMASPPGCVRIYQVQVPLTGVLANRIVDVTPVRAEYEAAFRAYASQAYSVASTYRMRRRSGRHLPRAARAELFWEISTAQYVVLHGEDPRGWPDTFRGLRPSALTDVLAYACGLRERRRLRALVGFRRLLCIGLG